MTNQAGLSNWKAGAPRTLLLATDRSARCDRPLDRAVQLAREWGATLVLLHVVENAPATADRQAIAERLRRTLLDELPSRDVRAQVRVEFGAVGDRLPEAAAEMQADLIVTGVSRYDEFGDYVLGTTVERLIRSAAAPVLVVKRRPQDRYRRLLIATDYSDCSALALDVLPAFPQARATLMHAYHVPFEGFLAQSGNEEQVRQEDRTECDAFLDRIDPAIRQRLEAEQVYGTPSEVMTTAVRERDIGLAVVGTHGRSGLGKALIGSTAETLMGLLPCDVLVVPAACGQEKA